MYQIIFYWTELVLKTIWSRLSSKKNWIILKNPDGIGNAEDSFIATSAMYCRGSETSHVLSMPRGNKRKWRPTNSGTVRVAASRSRAGNPGFSVNTPSDVRYHRVDFEAVRYPITIPYRLVGVDSNYVLISPRGTYTEEGGQHRF